jgi:hypothetical protein
MKRLYHVYTIIAATVIFLSSLLLVSGAVRLANLIIITPLFLLAWINFTNPYQTRESIWSLRMLIVVLCLSALGLLAVRLPLIWPEPTPPAPAPTTATCPEPSPCSEPNPEILLPDYRPIVGKIKITNPQGAGVYPRPNAGEAGSQSLPFDQFFPYYDFQDGFFEVLINATATGWVKLDDVIPRLDNIKPDQLE